MWGCGHKSLIFCVVTWRSHDQIITGHEFGANSQMFTRNKKYCDDLRRILSFGILSFHKLGYFSCNSKIRKFWGNPGEAWSHVPQSAYTCNALDFNRNSLSPLRIERSRWRKLMLRLAKFKNYKIRIRFSIRLAVWWSYSHHIALLITMSSYINLWWQLRIAIIFNIIIYGNLTITSKIYLWFN